MATKKDDTYTTLTQPERLALAEQALKQVETEHFQLTLAVESAGRSEPVQDERLKDLAARKDRLQEIVSGLKE